MIKSHKELAEKIRGKRILHLNSYGKDSAVVLEWLCRHAEPASVVSVHFEHFSPHPGDDAYEAYQRRRYSSLYIPVTFIREPDAFDLNRMQQGVFQYPLRVLTEFNQWEHYDFEIKKQAEAIRATEKCDYIAAGLARYESVARATDMHRKGIFREPWIYPIGMFSKEQVLSVIQASGMRLHPCYKLMKSTPDRPSYYKMRAAFIADPSYKERMFTTYPLLALDEYRYERMLNASL